MAGHILTNTALSLLLGLGVVGGGGPEPAPLNARVVYLGDSLMANGPMRSARQLAQAFTNSRLRPGVGCNQGVGGERMDQMRARIAQVIGQAPSMVVFNGGTNDLAAGHSLATMQGNHQGIVDDLTAAGITRIVRHTIPRSTNITGGAETIRGQFNQWLRGRSDFKLVDLETVIDPSTSDCYDGTHYTWIGARKVAAAEVVVTGPMIASGSILYADAADALAKGNLETNWDFAGDVSGVATGWAIANNTTATVTPSKTTDSDGFQAQRIAISGTVSAQNTVRLTNTVPLSPSAQPGEFFDFAIRIKATAADGTSAPVNLRALYVGAGSVGNWASNNPDSSAGLVDIPLDYVFRTEPIGLSLVSGSIAFEVTVQLPTGTPDVVLTVSRLRATKTELAAYATPTPITAGKTAPRVIGTATVGSVLTAENQTWAGGLVTYTYQWQASGVDIPGATSRQYTIQAGDLTKTIRCVITGVNSYGSTPYTTAATGTVT